MSINVQLRSWIAKTAAPAVILATSAVALGVSAGPAEAACSVVTGNGSDNTAVTYSGGNLNLRYTPSSTSCLRGTIHAGHVLVYKCWWEGQTVNGYTTWTYLYDRSLAKWGWASDAYLPNVGSAIECNSVTGVGG